MQKPLREEINDAVVKYLEHTFETGGTVDVAEMAHEMAQSLIDMIMEQEEEHQAPLLASTIVSLGDEYLQRRGLVQTIAKQIFEQMRKANFPGTPAPARALAAAVSTRPSGEVTALSSQLGRHYHPATE